MPVSKMKLEGFEELLFHQFLDINQTRNRQLSYRFSKTKLCNTNKENMSKRSVESSQGDSPLVKKVKHNDATIKPFQDVPLSLLSTDEISSILPFLFIGEVLMLSMASKELKTKIESIVRDDQPHVLAPFWSITKALRTRNKLTLSQNDQLVQLGNLVKEHKLEISQLTEMLQISRAYRKDPSALDCIKLLSTQVTDGERLADVVTIEWRDDDVKRSMSYEDADYSTLLQKKTVKIPITCASSLKNLNLNLNTCSRMELYQMLSGCYALESLSVCIEDSGSYRKRTTTDDKEEVHPDTIYIPVLHSLKKLTISACYDDETSIQFVVDLLQIAPNLESFDFTYTKDPDDRLLKHLAKHCPKLKKLYVQGDDSATPLENQFTDEGILDFMTALPELTDLILHHCCEVSGKVFTKIGRCGAKLQNLLIQRIATNGDLCDQYDDVHFGGGELKNLQRLIFEGYYEELPDNFTDSIIEIAPNLTEIISDKVKMDKIVGGAQNIKSIDLRRSSPPSDIEMLTRLGSLETLTIGHNFRSGCPITVNHLNSCSWTNLKNLSLTGVLPPKSDEWLQALVKACPNLQALDYVVHSQEKGTAEKQLAVFGQTLLDLLEKDTNWPDLRILRTKVESQKIIALRPWIITETHYDISEAFESGTMRRLSEGFERSWLVYDPYVHEEEDKQF